MKAHGLGKTLLQHVLPQDDLIHLHLLAHFPKWVNLQLTYRKEKGVVCFL